MSEVILHVGMPKTGTSSIQKAFFGYDDGRLAYAPFKWSNHGMPIGLTYRSLEEQLPRLSRKGIDNEKYLRDRDYAREILEKTLKGGRETVIISGETMIGFTVHQHQDLLKDVLEHRDAVRVLAYVRDPISHASSVFQQGLKAGNKKFRVPLQEFKGCIGRLFEAYGRDNVELVPYRPSSFIDGNVVLDFAARVGANEKLLKMDERANESMSMVAAGALYLWNREGNFAVDTRTGFKARSAVIETLQRVSRLSEKRLERIQASGEGPPLEFQKFRLSRKLIIEHLDLEDVHWMEETLGTPLLSQAAGGDGENDGVRSAEDMLELGEKAIEKLKPVLIRKDIRLPKDTTVAALDALYLNHKARFEAKSSSVA